MTVFDLKFEQQRQRHTCKPFLFALLHLCALLFASIHEANLVKARRKELRWLLEDENSRAIDCLSVRHYDHFL